MRARPLFIFLLLPLLIAAGLAWRTWQGPELPGYEVQARPLVQRVVASGEVDSRSVAQIGSEITGVVAARYVREGDQVRAGELLLELHDREWRARLQEAQAQLDQLVASTRPQAQAALREAESNLAQASRERERRARLTERQLISVEQREQAQRAETAARAARDRARLAAAAVAADGSETRLLEQRLEAAHVALARTRLLAPVDGIIQSRQVEPGDLVQPGRTLLTLAPLDSLEIRLPLDEKSLAPIEPGLPATVIADAWPERPLAARVSYLAPRVEPTTGTLDVHLRFEQPAEFLRQGMTVSVSIETGRREQALALPNDSLRQRDGARAEVLRLDRDNRVERVTVRLGLRGTGLSEVTGGLAAGDRVLIGDARPGQRVRLRQQAY
ncbi:efflux RND transporter periplasmic adaptor subunit [Stutzerimonas tarimensis]|uniref:Efflux RND transporter periplasmic adaptor subunit n=1 Tax=Stutzerimonas tarimensis TaxID=1507735 RepID=A0ABV7T7I9_9GAMM